MAAQGQKSLNHCIYYGIEQGVNYFDTAANYGNGMDETMLGAAFKEKQDKVILATKVGYTRNNLLAHRDANQLMQQFEGSLRRLQTSYVDIIQIHEADFLKWWTDDIRLDQWSALIMDDEGYDFADAPVVQFLEDARSSGKARFIGLTGKNARLLARIMRTIQVDSVMVAHQFNPIYRNASEFLFPVASELETGVVIGAPLMKGWLAVPQEEWRDNPPDWMDAPFKQSYFGFIDIHRDYGIPMAELCIRWMLEEHRQQSVVVGFSNFQEVKSNISAVYRGALSNDINASIEKIGIVHPLAYQGRTII